MTFLCHLEMKNLHVVHETPWHIVNGKAYQNVWHSDFHSRPHWSGIGQLKANGTTLLVAHYIVG